MVNTSELQAESRLQSAKRSYLESSLLHSELGSVLDSHPHSSTQPRPPVHTRSGAGGSEGRVGREVLATGEAQHCLRLHPEASLLGVTTDHLRHAGGRVLSGVRVCVCVCQDGTLPIREVPAQL